MARRLGWWRMGVAVTAAILALAIGPASVDASCIVVANPPYELDPAEVGVDTSAPGRVTAVDVDIEHHHEAGCLEQGDSCDGVTAIRIYVTATDDRTVAGDMGYELTLVSGSYPSRLRSLPTTSVDGYGGVLYLAGGNVDDYSFVLGVRAVDKAGNRGPITEIEISHGSAGCVLGSRAASNGVLWLALLGWLLVRRRSHR